MPPPSTRSPRPLADGAVLDEVVWSALCGAHAVFATGDGNIKRYLSDVAPFGAVRPPDQGSPVELAMLLRDGTPLMVVTATMSRPFGGVPSDMRTTVDQMVLVDAAVLAGVPVVDAKELAVGDVPDMMELVQATRPGPFGRRTIELGRYLGIREAGRLVAMGGERMRVPGFTEISAVCVSPGCRGRGYAAALIGNLAMAILGRGDTPFLHVVTENVSAIALYERLGFRLRRRFGLSVFAAQH